ncbi:MAG: restriction endonuclease subunit S [Euryarchaeota archaeon]|nr:restriction endonuclease subunit S [Euryarchaeota archaeon]MCG2735436.1 restriction endonuclease subunit S [Candidatus Methanoperedenaceae archaeon]
MSLGLTPQQIIDKDTHPLLRISKNWTRIELHLVADIQNGYAFSSEEFSKDSGLPLIRIRDILKHETEDFFTGSFPEEFLVDKGDILIGMDGDFNASVWKGPTGLLNQRVCRVLPNSKNYFDKFLIICLQPYLNAINSETSAVTVKHLSSRTIQQIPLPLPPLSEQRAIVSKIEQLFSDLDNGIENFKKAQAQLKLYRQSVLKAACEGKLVPTEAELARAEGRDYEAADVLLARILKERQDKWNGKGKYKEPAAPDTSDLPMLPEGWGWISIDQISQSIVDCLHSTAKFIPDGKYCIDTNCIEQGKILFEKARFVSEETYYERVSRLVPQADDILFAREGTIGTAVLVPQNIELCLGQRMMMFRAANGVIPLYFMWALQSQIFEKQWKGKVLGSTVPHVNIGDIKVMAMSLPPTFEQRRIVAEVERRLSVSDKMEETITASLQKAESLRQSILKKAFEGKLLNKRELEKARNAPDWEPAEKLLERIRQEKARTGEKKGK